MLVLSAHELVERESIMKTARTSSILLSVAASILLAYSLPAAAQDSDDWKSWPTGGTLRVGVGFFYPNLDTRIVIRDEAGNIGTGISFEKNLGLDDSKSTGLLSIDWRFFKRHTMSYRYFDLKRSAVSNSSVSVGIGGIIIDIDLPIQSFFDIAAHEIAYSYSLIFDEKKELHLGLGISLQDLELGIQGTASSPNPGEIINSTLNSTAPLPTLNIGFNYAFTDKWLFISRLGWLALEFDLGADEDLSGQIINSVLGIHWQAFDHVGFSAQYQVMDVDADYGSEGVIFSLNYDYAGPVLGISGNF